MLKDLRDQKSMERRLVVPNLGVKMVAVDTERCLGEFKSFIGSNLDGGWQGQAGLEQEKGGENRCQDERGVFERLLKASPGEGTGPTEAVISEEIM
jgi:hypothetical protein